MSADNLFSGSWLITGAGVVLLCVAASMQRQARVLNLAIQGQAVLAAGMFGIVNRGDVFTPGRAFTGVILACVSTCVMGATLWVLSYVARCNVVLAGLALHQTAQGLRGILVALSGSGKGDLSLPEMPAWFGQPGVMLAAVVMAVGYGYFVTEQSEASRGLRAVQHADARAQQVGVPVFRIQLQIMLMCGVLTAFGAILIVLPGGYLLRDDAASIPPGFLALALASIGRGRVLSVAAASIFFVIGSRAGALLSGAAQINAVRGLWEVGLPLVVVGAWFAISRLSYDKLRRRSVVFAH